jgi:acyl-CoA synthetase (AMP-forming)/AMP-acid ligase II
MPTNIFAEFEQTANLYPDNIALEMFSDDGDTRYTYQQTLDLARRVGQSLRNRGVIKGDRIAFWARLGPQWVIAYLGAMHSGAVVVPLDVEYGAKALSSILAEIECKFIFSVREKLPLLKETLEEINGARAIVMLDSDEDRDGVLSINSLIQPSREFSQPPEITPEDIATIFFTSGTTGKPKGVVIQHRSIVNSVHGLMQCLQVTVQDKVLAQHSGASGKGRRRYLSACTEQRRVDEDHAEGRNHSFPGRATSLLPAP